jgi:uroporphyrin-III C-methyltransferase/precorrin-2 dehydrogenase/sirohydrochlorin ferrochelatase/uroporphyrin-III C-methyltransferase
VRLKGGDPYIFGRGGEEAEYLVRHGVDCEVVPGVTAAAGCAAEFGIPLTHRGLATGVRFVTGHARENDALELDWASLADPETTLVVYMGLGTAGEMSARLIAAGLPAATPCAAIANGTTAGRRICRTTLAELPQSLVEARLSSPVLLVIGRVAAMAELLAPAAATPPRRAQARHA